MKVHPSATLCQARSEALRIFCNPPGLVYDESADRDRFAPRDREALLSRTKGRKPMKTPMIAARLLASLLLFVLLAAANAAPPPGKGNPGKTATLSPVKSKDWDETHVRRVLAAFAYGGQASDGQLQAWSRMNPKDAIVEMLTFDTVNPRLSPPEDDTDLYCGSLEALQEFWSSDDPANPMRADDRHRYATLTPRDTLSTANLQRTWSKAVGARGCNPFLHKMGLYLTNYHASISVHKTRAALIRDYYDRIIEALAGGADFVEVMGLAASHAAVARAYGHQYSRYDNQRAVFYGTDDFGREFHQLFFRIQGTTEDPVYHEDTTIEHTAWLLSGMNLDKQQNAYGSANSGDWWVAPIVFTDHLDMLDSPRTIRNASNHYHSSEGAGSCLEILHATVCGANAGEKIAALAPIAANHPESLENVPVYLVDFFADDNLDEDKIAAIRGSWAAADFDLLAFLRAYAISREFHGPGTVKFKTAFDRNLVIANGIHLDNEAVYARNFYDSPFYPMAEQGAEVFEPAHDVFGGQTGLQAANNRYIFKEAYWRAADNPGYLYDPDDNYTLDGVTELTWRQDWGSVIPVDAQGQHRVGDVASWLWQRFIADGGKNFDVIARAQVQALLATRRDFGWTVDRDNPGAVYSSSDIVSGAASAADRANADALMDLLSADPAQRREANIRVGMAVAFITMTPYAFAMEGQ